MRTLFIALAVGGALTTLAAPVLAQAYQDRATVEQRLDNISYRIDEGLRVGDLSLRQADRLRMELRHIDDLDRRYIDEGMTYDDQADLNSRLDLLASRVNYDVSMTRDDQEYGSGYGR